MANTLLTPSIIAREAISTLYETTIMANMVHRDYEADFAGKVGDTITIRKPATFTANVFDRATGIVLQNATESSTTLTLDTLLDVSFAVTAEDMALKITDFQEQFLAPAMEAISQKIDKLLWAQKANVVHTVGTDGTPVTDGKILVDAAKVLNDYKVPMRNRATALSTSTTAQFQKDTQFMDADRVGDDGTALREASIGRKYGFDNFMTQNATGNDSLAFHKDAFALVTRTLQPPMGIAASQHAQISYKGLGLRVVYGYDQTKKQDVVSIDTLCGVKTLDANKAVIILA